MSNTVTNEYDTLINRKKSNDTVEMNTLDSRDDSVRTEYVKFYNSSLFCKKLVYDGSVIKGTKIKHGRGSLYDKSGKLMYKGDWINDQYHGYGTLYINEDVNTGTWVNGKLCGHGTLHMDGKLSYEGHWNNDKFHGAGTYYSYYFTTTGTWNNGSREGIFKSVINDNIDIRHNRDDYLDDVYCYDISTCIRTYHNDKIHDLSTSTYSNGIVIETMYAHGKKNGVQITKSNNHTNTYKWVHGICSDDYMTVDNANGVQFTGSANILKGWVYGVITFSNGDTYTGGFNNNCIHGNGTYTFANGDVYYSKWHNGVSNMVGKFNCDVVVIKYTSKPNGEFTSFIIVNCGPTVEYKTDSGDVWYRGLVSSVSRLPHGRGSLPLHNFDGYFSEGRPTTQIIDGVNRPMTQATIHELFSKMESCM